MAKVRKSGKRTGKKATRSVKRAKPVAGTLKSKAPLASAAALFRTLLAQEGAQNPKIHAKLLSTQNPADVRSLRFEVGQSSVKSLRVILDYYEMVTVDNVAADSRPRAKGTWVAVTVQMIGNPRSTVTLKVTNGEPKQLNCAIPDGVTHWSEQRVVEASWGA